MDLLRQREGQQRRQGLQYDQTPLQDSRISGHSELEDMLRLQELHGRPEGYEAPEMEDSSKPGPIEMQGDSK